MNMYVCIHIAVLQPIISSNFLACVLIGLDTRFHEFCFEVGVPRNIEITNRQPTCVL